MKRMKKKKRKKADSGISSCCGGRGKPRKREFTAQLTRFYNSPKKNVDTLKKYVGYLVAQQEVG